MGTRERDPCPDRILDDIGFGFGLGFIGGSALHFLKGSYNSPNGARLVGAFQAMRLNSPRIGGSFAAWGTLFSAMDCTMVYVRQKEDPWNSILAGAATGGLLSLRRGLGTSVRSAAFGGIFIALMEGSMIMANKAVIAQQQAQLGIAEEEQLPAGFNSFPATVNGAAGASAVEESDARREGWLRGWFGGGKKVEDMKSKGNETKILESFDVPPMPNFEFK